MIARPGVPARREGRERAARIFDEHPWNRWVDVMAALRDEQARARAHSGVDEAVPVLSVADCSDEAVTGFDPARVVLGSAEGGVGPAADELRLQLGLERAEEIFDGA